MNITETNSEIKSFRVKLESLDGGYVSDITGKRSIYRQAKDIVDYIDLETTIDNLEENEYHLNIDIVPKDKIAHYNDIMALHTQEEPRMSYEEAKAEGIIQPVEKFDPNPIKNEKVIERDIKVTETNCYTAAELKEIDWKLLDSQLPLTTADRVTITGMNQQAVYNQWRKALVGTASFHLSKTRIGFTILAKYYEANVDIKATTKAQLDELKAQTLEQLQMIETLCSRSGKYIIGSEVMKIVSKMRKPLL